MSDYLEWEVTVKGWVLLCPVWIANIDTDGPTIIPMYRWLDWWLSFQWFLQWLVGIILTAFIHDYEPMWSIHHAEDVEPFIIKVETNDDGRPTEI